MWRQHIQSLSSAYELFAPANLQTITQVETTLNLILPAELREFLQATNGLYHKSAFFEFIFSIEHLAQENRNMRSAPAFTNYMPFDHLLFFAAAGNGDKLGFPISRRGVVQPVVFAWNHEADSRNWCAPSLRIFLQWWHEGKITL